MTKHAVMNTNVNSTPRQWCALVKRMTVKVHAMETVEDHCSALVAMAVGDWWEW